MKETITRRKLLATGAAGATVAALPLSAQEQGKLYKVEIRNFRFKPAVLEVRPGDRIRWTNADQAPHDATALDRSWNTRTLRRGQSGEVTVTAGMSTDYFCSIHPSMRAKLKILSA